MKPKQPRIKPRESREIQRELLGRKYQQRIIRIKTKYCRKDRQDFSDNIFSKKSVDIMSMAI